MIDKIDLFKIIDDKENIIKWVKRAVFLLLWISILLIGCSPGQQGPIKLFLVDNARPDDFAISFSHDSESYAYIPIDTNESQVHIRSFLNRRSLQTLPHPNDNAIASIEFSHDNRFLAVSSEASVDVWDIEKEQIVKSFLVDEVPRLTRTIGVVAFSPDDSLLALNLGHTLRIWNLQSEEVVVNIRVGEHFAYAGSIKFSSSGHLVAFNMGDLMVWNFEDEILTKLGIGSDTFTFTPDSSELVASRQGDIYRWQMPDGEFAGKFLGKFTPSTPTGYRMIGSAVLPPGGEEVIIYTYDHQYFIDHNGEDMNNKFFVELWNVNDEELLWQIPLNDVDLRELGHFIVSPKGDRLAMIGMGYRFTIWEIE